MMTLLVPLVLTLHAPATACSGRANDLHVAPPTAPTNAGVIVTSRTMRLGKDVEITVSAAGAPVTGRWWGNVVSGSSAATEEQWLNRDSGSWSGQRYVQGGREAPRAVLYMAALAATRWNPVIGARYPR